MKLESIGPSQTDQGTPHIVHDESVRVFGVVGLDCAAEVALLEGELLPLLRGHRSRLAFDVLTGRFSITAAPAELSDSAIVDAVARAGFQAEPLAGTGRGAARRKPSLRVVATAVSGVALGLGLVAHGISAGSIRAPFGLVDTPAPPPMAAVVMFLVAMLAGLLFVAPRAWAALRAVRGDMNLLMTVAVAGAVGLGEYLEAASVSFLFAFSLLLESWSVGRARRAVQALLDLAPPRARRRDLQGREEEVAPHEVSVGELVVIHPGERVPLDGEVFEGAAHVDTSPLTGESTPQEAAVGTEVLAGSLCLDGVLVVRVVRPAVDSLLARIVRRVTEARRHRARAEQWVDRFARIYTPVVFLLAAATALIPPLLGVGPWTDWFYRSLVLLVIGCPCALVISTPVSVVAGLAAAARNGVLVKGGDILELPARLAAVAFDKTGTLTAGALRVERVIPLDRYTPSEILSLAAALNERSTHPVGRAIVEASQSGGLRPFAATGVRVIPGRGAEGWVDGVPVWAGSRRLLQERGAESREVQRHAADASLSGGTVVMVGTQSSVWGIISLTDTPRTEAAGATAALRRLGIGRIALLTGDTPEAAHAVGSAVGISERYARLLPEEKARVLDRIRLETHPGAQGVRARHRDSLVAFVGDGVNDAPALAAADLGIAMGDGGTDVALETADVALLRADLSRVPWLVQHSRRVVRVIRVNIVFALAVKALFAALAATGHATLWAAISADMGASLLVIANSLRLLVANRAYPGESLQ